MVLSDIDTGSDAPDDGMVTVLGSDAALLDAARRECEANASRAMLRAALAGSAKEWRTALVDAAGWHGEARRAGEAATMLRGMLGGPR